MRQEHASENAVPLKTKLGFMILNLGQELEVIEARRGHGNIKLVCAINFKHTSYLISAEAKLVPFSYFPPLVDSIDL